MLTGSFPGMWWRLGSPDARVAGVLSIGYDNLTLDLIGSFAKLEETGSLSIYPVIHGETTSGKVLTLVDAMTVNESFSMHAPDLRSTVLSPSMVLDGAHIEDTNNATWDKCSIELERMTAWAQPAGLAQSLELTEERHLAGVTFRYEVPAPIEKQLPGAVVTIGPAQQISSDLLHEAKISVSVTADFVLDSPCTIQDILQRYLKPLVDLVLLATQKPTSVITLRVTEGTPPRWVEVLYRRDPPAGDEPRRLNPRNALFLLPDLLKASPDALEMWYRAAADLEAPFDLVFAVRSTPDLFVEHRLLNLVQAAEAYQESRIDGRAMTDEKWDRIVAAAMVAVEDSELAEQVRGRMAVLKRPSLRARIENLLERGGSPLRGILMDPDKLAKRASRVRNNLSHGVSSSEHLRELFDTSEELILVLEFHLLRELGFSGEDAASRLRQASPSYGGLQVRLNARAGQDAPTRTESYDSPTEAGDQ